MPCSSCFVMVFTSSAEVKRFQSSCACSLRLLNVPTKGGSLMETNAWSYNTHTVGKEQSVINTFATCGRLLSAFHVNMHTVAETQHV